MQPTGRRGAVASMEPSSVRSLTIGRRTADEQMLQRHPAMNFLPPGVSWTHGIVPARMPRYIVGTLRPRSFAASCTLNVSGNSSRCDDERWPCFGQWSCYVARSSFTNDPAVPYAWRHSTRRGKTDAVRTEARKDELDS
jgi:hypothetical protein